ncbi:MAG: hypothetical protein P1U39_07850 [Legionellaceae bacterium]|nr:hypothetical protein [Legionellaceae bacterium]
MLKDPCLKKFNISTSKHDINEDPVRRYFESHLAHNTLEASLDDLDILLLHKNFHLIFKLLQRSDHAEFCAMIDQYPPKPYVFFDEYLDGLFQLHQPKSYRSLSPRETEGRLTPEDIEAILEVRKQKLILIIKCMYASAWVNTQSPHSDLPLNVYNHRPESPYSPTNRGRTPRRDVTLEANQEQNVRPHTRGIMRSYMPLSHDDNLFAEEPLNYTRPADMYTYLDTHYLSTSPYSLTLRTAPCLISKNH